VDWSCPEKETTEYPPGRVIAQSPARGTKVAQGSTVSIVISKPGQEQATVPSVLGQAGGQAQATLRNAGFGVALVTQPESSRAGAKKNKGRVWKQSPASQTKLPKGSTVTIYVNP
jgi:serine/threonine-protein kinase